MPKVKYKGFADERVINKGDFTRNDIDHSAVKFNSGNDFTAEVSDEVLEFLLAQNEPVAVLDDEGNEVKSASVTSEDADAVAAVPEGGEGLPDDAGDSVTTGTGRTGTRTGRGSSTAGR